MHTFDESQSSFKVSPPCKPQIQPNAHNFPQEGEKPKHKTNPKMAKGKQKQVVLKRKDNQKQAVLKRVYDKLKDDFIQKGKYVDKINVDENCLALRLYACSKKHIESMSKVLYCIDDEINLEELSLYILRRRGKHVKGITAYLRSENKSDMQKVLDICTSDDMKISVITCKKSGSS
jgi:hypothetical protein